MRRASAAITHRQSSGVASLTLCVAVRLANYTYRQSSAHDTTSAAFKERRAQASKWETAVFGKMFYEPGARERFAAVSQAELEEQQRLEREAGGKDSSSSSPGELQYHQDMSVEEVKQLPLPVVKKHIVSLLTRGEFRITNAPDYGSYMMMQHMHTGEQMISDAEALLEHFRLMTPEMQESIEDLRSKGKDIKYDLDLAD